MQRIHHLAVDVELELAGGGIPDPDGPGALVPGQPVEDQLRQAPLAGEPVHDLDLRRISRDRAQQPVAPRARFGREARAHQRVEREGGVA